MKTCVPHVIATKQLSCRDRSFLLGIGTLIFLNNASLPMIQWLQEIYTNDSEALQGNTDILMSLPSPFTKPKTNKQTHKSKSKKKKQLFFRLRSRSKY